MKVYSCEQMRKIEENAYMQGMSYITMMENAGFSCHEKIAELTDDIFKPVVVLCGSGKNGGDGFVIARLLKNKGYDVKVILVCGMPKAAEAEYMYSLLDGVEIYHFDNLKYDTEIKKVLSCSGVIVDCIFGIGFKGQLRENTQSLVSFINSNSKALKISVDIPSGLKGDAPLVDGEPFKSDYTLAVTCKKPAHVLKPAADYCGKVIVLDIGFSSDCYNLADGCAFECADYEYISKALPLRKTDSNKGTYGKLLCICGSMRMQGAAVLCSKAAVNSGAGIVISAFPVKAYSAIASKLTEPLMLPLKDDENGFLTEEAIEEIKVNLTSATAVVIGCGLGVTDGTRKVFDFVIKNAKCPVIIDADGLNILSENTDILKSVDATVVLTPHPGEMSRLIKKNISDIQRDRISACKELSSKTGAVVLLKGSNTVISGGSRVFINPTGNQGMAKGGSGDVLSGIIGSFLAQGVSCFESAVSGAYIHGECGDKGVKKLSFTGLTPSSMTEMLPELFSNYENKVD